MGSPKCDVCGGAMKRNGYTKAGTARWRCKNCGSSKTRKADNTAKRFASFLSWLFSKQSIVEFAGSRVSFWRRTHEFWRLWPIAPFTGEVFDVVFVDGIWFGHKAVVLIARSREHVVSWHLARSESAEAWAALMMRIPEPLMVVSDGGTGFAKAHRAVWPNARIQRCVFHAFTQVKSCTTSRPKLPCGQELYKIARGLLKVKDADQAAAWLAEYMQWCTRWESFLREFTLKDGKRQYTHERLRKARRGLNKLVRDKTLFTFIEMQEERGGVWPATNNAIEGGVNARLREMLRIHRGLPPIHRIKAVMWWCYMHTEDPLLPAEILRIMPTDDDVEGLFATAASESRSNREEPNEYGSGIVWSEFHMPTEYRR